MKNKELFYLALAIGGAFLIHKYMMKSTPVSNLAIPLMPTPNVVPSSGNMLSQDTIQSLAINEIMSSDTTATALNNVHPINEYDVANTYQTLYGRTISGMYKTCPTII
jgi:hypothetical protein